MSDFRQAFATFVTSGKLEDFLTVRRMILESADYQPYSETMTRLNKLLNEEKWNEALEAAKASIPNLLLSPRLHLMMAAAHGKLGDAKAQRMEQFFGFQCLKGIELTGNGSRERPFLVLHVEDEYDVLGSRQKTLQRQSMTNNGVVGCDMLECTDGTTIWFNIQDATAYLNRKFDASPPA